MKDKLEGHVGDFSFYDYFPVEGANTLIIAYGVTARAAGQAIAEIKRKKVSLLVLKTLWPVPEDLIARKARKYGTIIVLEMNLGQYVHEIERVLKDKEVRFYGRMDGTLITPSQIKEVIADA
jgi:2-oxoglutarate ferredoxin oxidoreductase subunit alpha